MTRIKRGILAHKRHKNLLAKTKGYRHGRKNLFRLAKQAVLQAGQFAYRDRRNKKRSARSLWIVQLNAAARSFDLPYKDFIYGLHKAEITLDRKVLAAMSVEAPEEFAKVVIKVKEALAK
jgi:large subunit ribosomal protein L20